MKTGPLPQLNSQVLDEASEWFVDFRVGDVDECARERFDEWLRRSPEHIRAYMEIAKTYVVLPSLTSDQKIDVPALIACARSEGNIVPFDHPSASCREGPKQVPVRRAAPRRPWLLGKTLAASVTVIGLAAAVATALMIAHRFPIYSTEVGERRSITLADGSTVDLNARSRVRIRFTKHERAVDLIEGQALFAVGKDPARPFVVHSGAAAIRAVGTQFDVYRKTKGTTVTVLEGRVAVVNEDALRQKESSPPAQKLPKRPPPELALVSAGEEVTVADGIVPPPKRANLAVTTAWLEHRLIFDGTPLSDVADQFNRYNTRQIVIEAGNLQEFHVSGVYSSTDPTSLIRFLRAQPGVRVIETDEGVRIARR
jgi:transmembrane sensor